jgi:LmbE family N-acetylglucosaminyl deacetylase
MPLPFLPGGFTGPLRIDVAIRFDALGGGPSQSFVALGRAGEEARLSFGQQGASDDLLFELVQDGTVYQLVAPDALVPGEDASFAAQIDEDGVMALFKDDALLGQLQAEVPLALPTQDLRGPETPFDAEVTDLTVEPLSPVSPDGSLIVIAHPDDDLLFMNPTLAEEIAAGEPVTTVYLTAGDAGFDAEYWEGREAGAKAAYALMADSDPGSWVDETVTLDVGGDAVEVQSSYLADAPQVRLYFLRTPDGIDGGGTSAYGFGSLEQLWDGTVSEVTTVDGAATYSSEDLTQVIGAIMTRHAPTDILLQDDSTDIEHSDHVHAADFAEAALPLYGEDVTVTRYQSYDTWGEEENLSPEDQALVTEIFETYAAFDPQVVDGAGEIREPYTDWVMREYVASQYDIVDGERIDVILPEPSGPTEPGPEDPAPTDPMPGDPGPEDPAPTDPMPGDPGPEDPAPTDPMPGDPGPEDPGDWTAGVFGSGGVFGNLLSGSYWGGGPAPTDPTPTDPDPTGPAPTEPAPTNPATAGAFGAGGFYDRFLDGNAAKWGVDPVPPDDLTPAPTAPGDPGPTAGGTGDPFGPGGIFEALMQADDDKWAALDAIEELETEAEDPIP